MRWGIPEYRLPKSILKKEIKRILQLPIDVKAGARVGKEIPFEELNQFDAVFLSPGAVSDLPLGIEGDDLKKIWRGGDFLNRINAGEKIRIGKEIMVIGGGNTAMDVARSALRLGSRVTVAYRRTRQEMPAIQDEIREAEKEGVEFEFLIQPVKITLLKNKRISVRFQRMQMRGRDKNNRSKAIPVQRSFRTREADGVITAVGEGVDLSWIPETLNEKGLIAMNPSLATHNPKVIAGGDAIDQPRSIVTAIASGKKGAISIDLYLKGVAPEDMLSQIMVGNKGALSFAAYASGGRFEMSREPRNVVTFDQLNTLYFEHSNRVNKRTLSHEASLKGFQEGQSRLFSRRSKDLRFTLLFLRDV